MHFDKNGGDDDERGDCSDDGGESERDYATSLGTGTNGIGAGSTTTVTTTSTTNGGSEPCFKCHLCDSSYLDRQGALDHIRINHAECYEILVSQGAMDNDHDASAVKQDDVENRKVNCLN